MCVCVGGGGGGGRYKPAQSAQMLNCKPQRSGYIGSLPARFNLNPLSIYFVLTKLVFNMCMHISNICFKSQQNRNWNFKVTISDFNVS